MTTSHNLKLLYKPTTLQLFIANHIVVKYRPKVLLIPIGISGLGALIIDWVSNQGSLWILPIFAYYLTFIIIIIEVTLLIKSAIISNRYKKGAEYTFTQSKIYTTDPKSGIKVSFPYSSIVKTEQLGNYLCLPLNINRTLVFYISDPQIRQKVVELISKRV